MTHHLRIVDQENVVRITDSELLEPYVVRAETAADEAEGARDIAVAASVAVPAVYATKAAGLAAVGEGGSFWSNEDGAPALYRDTAGVAVLQYTFGDNLVYLPTAALTTGSIALGNGLRNLGGTGAVDADGNMAFGVDAGVALVDGWANSLFGYKAGRDLSNKATVNSYGGVLGNVGNSFFGYNVGPVADGALDCSLFGTNCGLNLTSAMDTCGFGIKALESMEAASETCAFGHGALQYVVGSGTITDIDNTSTVVGVNYSWGHRLAAFGDQAGRFLADGSTHKTRGKKSTYFGANTRSGENFAINENVFGYGAIGMGSNTNVFGNSSTTQQRLPGNICAGNGALSIAPSAPLHIYQASSAGLLADGIRVSRPGASTAYAFMSFDTGDTAYFGGVYPTTKANVAFRVSDGSVHLTPLFIAAGGNVGINELVPDYKLDVNGAIGFTPGSSVAPVDNGDVVFELTTNTSFTVKAKGSDGTIRTNVITLS